MTNALGDTLLFAIEDCIETTEEALREVADPNLYVAAVEGGNSIGNLALHLAGNLQTLIGKITGGVPYERDRDYEFAARDLSRVEILERLRAAREVCRQVLPSIDAPALASIPEDGVFEGWNRGQYLMRAIWHLGYHTGQMVLINKRLAERS